MIYKKWDIVLLPFPFTDLTITKKRPGLVISPDEYNNGQDVLIVFITSQLKTEKRMGDYLIEKWKESKLPLPSMIRIKIATIDKSIVIKKIGKLVKPDTIKFQKELLKFFRD